MKEKSTNSRTALRASNPVKTINSKLCKKKVSPKTSKRYLRCLMKTKLRRRSTPRKNIAWPQLSTLINEEMCSCVICTQLLIAPVVLDCGHIYCMQCLEEYHETRCSLCRKENADKLELATAIQGFIRKCVLPRSEESLDYWCRQESYDYSQRKRQVDFRQIRRGDRVDVRDDTNLWRQATLVNFYKKDGESIVSLNMGEQGQFQFISLPTSSQRLASFGFFTDKGFERYKRPSFLVQMTKSLEDAAGHPEQLMLPHAEVF